MKIKLTNFGCWRDNTFEFNETGINLLSAKSGDGKTTICNAIVFALFGNGRKKSVATHGTRSAKVELWCCINNQSLHIIRTTSPNRLVVNQSLEDAEAQAYIHTLTGDDQGMIYLEQNGTNTFVVMDPKSKLEYLEKITFSHSNLLGLKDRLKNLIKTTEQKKIEIDAKKGFIDDSLLTKSKPSTDLSNSLIESIPTISAIDSHLISLNEQQTQLTTTSKSIDEQILVLKQYQLEYQTYLNQVKTLTDTRNVFISKRDMLEFVNDDSINSLKDEIVKHKCQLELDRLRSLYDRNQQLYSDLISKEQVGIDQEIKELEETSIQSLSRRDLQNKINNLRKSLVDQSHRQDLVSKLENLEFNQPDLDEIITSRSSLKSQIKRWEELTKAYTCPTCNSALRLDEDKLVCIGTSNDQDSHSQLQSCRKEFKLVDSRYKSLLNLKTQVETLTDQLENIPCETMDEESMKEELLSLEHQLESLVAREQARVNLDKRQIALTRRSESLASQSHQLTLEITQLENSLNDWVPTDSLETCEKNLVSQLAIKRQFIDYNKNIDELSTKLDKLIKPVVFDSKSIEDYENEREIVRSQLESILYQQSRLVLLKTFYQQQTEYNNLINLQSEYSHQLQSINTRLSACYDLKSCISKAETLAIETTIETLNTNIQSYLDAFFEDDPMVARINTVKAEGKKTERQQVHIDILYKGMDIDISRLSGGEYDRVVLAFMLCIMELVQSPIVLLDECISSLDQDTAERVCSFLREQSKNRCTILIAHQIINGLFDQVVAL